MDIINLPLPSSETQSQVLAAKYSVSCRATSCFIVHSTFEAGINSGRVNQRGPLGE